MNIYYDVIEHFIITARMILLIDMRYNFDIIIVYYYCLLLLLLLIIY
jgi:hypothetical protein